MNNKNNLLLLLSSLFLVTFVASCGEVASTPSVPIIENTDTTNTENSQTPDSTDDEWIWWDDVETDGSQEEEDDTPKYNTINYLEKFMYYSPGTDYSETRTFDPANGVHRYEAELCAELTGAAIIEKETHIGYLENDATVTFKITSSAACKVLLAASLSTNPNNPDGIWFDSQYSVKVNDKDIDTGDVWILPTLNWYTFRTNSLAAIDLLEGENVIVFTGYIGESNIDHIVLSPERGDTVIPEFTYAKDVKIEAEDCLLYDCRIEEDEKMSNGKNVGYTTANTALEFIVNVDQDVETKLIVNAVICANSQYSTMLNQRFGIILNGSEIDINDTVLPETDETTLRWWLHDYSELEISSLKLNKGRNHILLKVSRELNLDYLKLN